MKALTNRPYPRVATPEIEVGGLPPQPLFRSRLSARWVRDEEGKLVCRWAHW